MRPTVRMMSPSLILRLRQSLRHRPRARTVSIRRHRLSQRLMRTLDVVDVAPRVECPLHLVQPAEAATTAPRRSACDATVRSCPGSADDTAGCAAPERRVSAARRQNGSNAVRCCTPRRPDGGSRCPRTSPPAGRGDGTSLPDGPARLGLVRTGRQVHQIARMIVDHGQRMTARPVGQLHPALEVHLPQQVRRRFLEPRQGSALTGRRHHTFVATQDLMHRRDRRRRRSSRSRQCASLRAPHAGCASRIARIRASTEASVQCADRRRAFTARA